MKASSVLPRESRVLARVSFTSSSAHLARDDNAGWVDVQVRGVGHDPLQARDAVVQAGRELGDLGH